MKVDKKVIVTKKHSIELTKRGKGHGSLKKKVGISVRL